MTSFRITAVLIASALAFPALAQTDTAKRRDNREEKQENRIEKGEKAGKITQKEAERLRRGQDHVRDVENKAEADGKVTAKERARIEQAQDVQSKKINRQKHDEQSRAGVGATAK